MKRALAFLFVYASLFFCAAVSFCQASPDAFIEANAFYKDGAYDKALERYASVLDSGIESTALFFNMGNCYFKKKEWGMAILNYERASRLSPRDPDIDFNERLVFQKIAAPPIKPSGALLHRLSQGLFQWLSLDEATAALAVFYILGLALIAARVLFPGNSAVFWRAGGALALLIFLFGCALLYDRIGSLGREAIIVKKTVAAKFEPSDEATTYFDLREGARVMILEDQKDWKKIRRADGKAGWIPRGSLEII